MTAPRCVPPWATPHSLQSSPITGSTTLVQRVAGTGGLPVMHWTLDGGRHCNAGMLKYCLLLAVVYRISQP